MKLNKLFKSNTSTLLSRFKVVSKMSISTFQKIVPAKVGDSIEQIETPALIVDLDAFEYNLKLLPKIVKEHSERVDRDVSIKPHYKTIKCPEIAYLQIKEGGATGITCAKLAEAESLMFGSRSEFDWDIFITNQLTSPSKLKRLAKLAQAAKTKGPNHPLISVCVDAIENINDLRELCIKNNIELKVLIELNVGQDRCGVDTPDQVLELAKEIKTPLRFSGIHAYNGSNQHTRSFQERRDIVLGEGLKEKLSKCIELLKSNNISSQIVTGGGTGTFPFEIETGLYNEVQPGSYVFMDRDYYDNKQQDGSKGSVFKHSLFILSRIQSINRGEHGSPRMVVDAGMKAISYDSGMPKLVTSLTKQPLEFINQGDEHGMIIPSNDNQYNFNEFKVNDLLKLIPAHCDPTVNLHEYFVGVREGKVEQIWAIEARGPGL